MSIISCHLHFVELSWDPELALESEFNILEVVYFIINAVIVVKNDTKSKPIKEGYNIIQ